MKTTIGILRVTLPYSYRRGKTIYYQRAVPRDLQGRCGTKPVKVKLAATDVRQAAREIAALNREVEAEWAALRASPDATPKTVRESAVALLAAWGLEPGSHTNDDDAVSLFHDSLDAKRERHDAAGSGHTHGNAPGADYLSPSEIEAAQLLAGSSKPKLSDALALYLKVNPKRNSVRFCSFTRASFVKLTTAVGDKPIADVSRDDGHAFVTKMQAQGLASGSIRRLLNTCRAVMTSYILEKQLDRQNPFASVPISAEGEDVVKALPYTPKELARLVAAVMGQDDARRWILGIVADTGARLAEVLGLALEDINLTAPVPYIVIKPHPWRRLKNANSARTVPLVGCALWAARRVKETAPAGERLAFPAYTKGGRTNSNSASAALNKWIKTGPKLAHTVHDLRHTMADRLRDVQCPADVRLAIGGWARTGVGEGYGAGYTLAAMAGWLKKVASL